MENSDDNPHINEPLPNRNILTRYTYFLPILSANFPEIGITEAYVNVYMVIIQIPVFSFTPRLFCIIVLAGDTIPVSIAPINIPNR